MGSFKVVIQPSAEEELRQAPFPFRRQIVQAIYKLKQNPRLPDCEVVGTDSFRFPVHGWFITYGVDEDGATVTIYAISGRKA